MPPKKKKDDDLFDDLKEGAFSREAKKKGMSVQAYATKVIKDLKGKTNGDKAKLKLLKRAVFAKNAKTKFNK